MGKAAVRRKKRRQQYFRFLALNNQEFFREEWGLRLESWTKKINKDSNLITNKDGSKVPPVYEVVDYAINELKGCGEKAFQMEAGNTHKILIEECNKAVANIVDRRMHRLLCNYARIEKSMR